MMKRRILTTLPLIALLLLGALFADRLISPRVTGTIDSPLIGKPLPPLPGITPPEGAFVINVFASWCAPCIVEHPHLMDLKKQGIAIIGIALRDTPEATDAFLKKRGSPYTTVIHDNGDGAGLTLGITGVPESFAVDANHIVRARIQGPLEDPRVIAPFVQTLGAQ